MKGSSLRSILTMSALLYLVSPSVIQARFVKSANKQGQTCGYNSCPVPREDMLNVHLVAHSHDDVGWLKTLDEYFYGEKNNIQLADVQNIIDTVVQALAVNPERRFIQVETAFFWQWWNLQNDTTKTLAHQLVDEGRLEFIGGGWSMNDEAATHYSSIISNMAAGFDELVSEFGSCGVPKIAWQIDPFGHSKEQANLFAQMGFDGLFFARIDYRDREERKANKELHMVWEASPNGNADEGGSIFTGIFPRHYSAPKGFCFGVVGYCRDEGFTEENSNAKVLQFLEHVEEARVLFDSEHIMFTMGDDFTYQDAGPFFNELDTLVSLVNERSSETGVHVLYSTPSCYLKALNEEQAVLPTKTDDFFPYASSVNSYWTGYFTSRPTFKFHERQASGLLQSAQQFVALSQNSLDQGQMRALKREVGVAQHHDAITGTAKQLVDSDYHTRLSNAEHGAQNIMGRELFMELGLTLDDPYQLFVCPQLNMSSCHSLDSAERLVFVVYNPKPFTSNVNVRLPVGESQTVTIHDEEGNEMKLEFIEIPEEVKQIPERYGYANFELFFEAERVPALGYRSFFIDQNGTPTIEQKVAIGEKISAKQLQDALPENLDISMKYYNSKREGGDTQASGAYIFRPDDETPVVMDIDQIEEFKLDQVTEWRVKLIGDWASYIIRKFTNRDEYEVEWLVGPIPKDTLDMGKEVIMVYTDKTLENDGEFWTDANGRQFMRRIKDERFSYELTDGDKEPVSSNYYPVTTGIFIKNATTSLSVINDRAQGGSSLNPGQIELMVHRRCYRDDGFGVGEALDEFFEGKPLVVRGKHVVSMGLNDQETSWRRLRMREEFLRPVFLFNQFEGTLQDWQNLEGLKTKSALVQDLPENANILSLERHPREPDTLVIRLENIYGPGEVPNADQPIVVNLEGLFKDIQVNGVVELSLGANLPLEDSSRLHWTTSSFNAEHERVHPMSRSIMKESRVTLNSMDIRTFKIAFSYV
ncbi:lysosomal alpha-mannosidase-like [Tigriopus californicus]|uniref:lysosomal alpha-mannosidase-like n=1 Tax=Tigriopus californicus TaxID=6832 RepID=UPI0027DA8A9A|nr:lysosomal alpha-mannosidase-like [Tigriopus californicus]